jgi:hypothetical protein
LEEYDLAVTQLERVEKQVTDALNKIPFVKKLLTLAEASSGKWKGPIVISKHSYNVKVKKCQPG